jgi:hypothetical protein
LFNKPEAGIIMSSASPYFNKETHIAICDELMTGSTDLQIQTLEELLQQLELHK